LIRSESTWTELRLVYIQRRRWLPFSRPHICGLAPTQWTVYRTIEGSPHQPPTQRASVVPPSTLSLRVAYRLRGAGQWRLIQYTRGGTPRDPPRSAGTWCGYCSHQDPAPLVYQTAPPGGHLPARKKTAKNRRGFHEHLPAFEIVENI